MVVGSDAPTENPRVEETAHAPLRGASPSHIESASELEDSPTANDCTLLALSTRRCANVDAAPSNLASLLAENQNCGVEAIFPHEETCCAAPVSLNQSEIFEWLDKANLGECPPLWVIQYLLDSKYYASMKATISKFEKQWNISVVNYQVQRSSEALFTAVRGASRREDIAIRSKTRLLRMEKLKMASLVGENPGFDFLQQCCHDDPALQIVIKKLLAKFPQWGIACVDGVLVNWEE
ncbi:hypothetical protein [Nostoc sp. MG11]|uniref:hypothetical protein n=1 Tax=Nostoc sp. MG11 TaxID=2721166 RepID=UPI001D002076|nr:hypothetical protein [Nostoc sp. MG11]